MKAYCILLAHKGQILTDIIRHDPWGFKPEHEVIVHDNG
jgi:hypothetical protein